MITDIAYRFESNSGVIIFSGMCDDGVSGVQAMHAMGGQVWTQDLDTCVISAMPDHVRNSGVCGYTGTSEQLAAKLIKYLEQKQAQHG